MASNDYREQVRRQRERLRDRYGSLLDDITAILFRHDPVCINFDTNTDEYEPEARTILPRLEHAYSVDDAKRIVLDEFRRWFGWDTSVLDDRCFSAAVEIWQLWCARRSH